MNTPLMVGVVRIITTGSAGVSLGAAARFMVGVGVVSTFAALGFVVSTYYPKYFTCGKTRDEY
jgi:hypothetical protein